MSVPAGFELGSDTLPRIDRLKGILGAGIRAPSAENRHYLRFDVKDDCVRLLSTDAGAWSAQPHRRMLALVSYGAVLENMSLHAQTYGLAQVTQWFPDPTRIELIAECRWQATARHPDELSAGIELRHTNRRFYARRPIDATALRRITDAVAGVPGASILWLNEGPARSVGLRAIRVAETERFRRQLLHQELFSAVRFDAGWHNSTEQGLPPGALSIEPPMRPLFAALRRWPLMRALGHVGVHHVLGLRAADLPCRLAPALGLVMHSDRDSSMAATGAGRALERAWLAASVQGLAFQPMAAAPALARQRAGDGWVAADAQARIVDALNVLTAGDVQSAFMFVRLGRAKPPDVVTTRPALERFF